MSPFEERPKRRSLAWALSLALAVATGAVLARTIEVATAPVGAPIDSDHRTAEVVAAFYEAANAVIRTGDAAALDPTVAPDFLDHAAPAGVPPDRAGLGRYLAAIHAASPTARLSVEDLIAVGDRAMARVTLRKDAPREFLGARLRGPPAAWGAVDVFRVADRRVVERWGDAANSVFLEALGTAPIGTQLPVRAGIALERVTLRPGDGVVGPTSETRLLWLESGILTLAVAAESRASVLVRRTDGAAVDRTAVVAAGAEATLAAGALAALPASTAYELRNDGPVPATGLAAVVHAPEAPDRSVPRADPAYADPGTPWPAGIAIEPLSGDHTTELPVGAATAEFGRMTLASGAALPEFTTPGPLLLTVDAGTLDVHVTTGSAWFRDATTGAVRFGPSASLAAGDGAFVPAGSTISFGFQHAPPAVVLLVAIAPLR